MRERVTLVRLTLVEARALANATGYRGPDPVTPRDQSALDRALRKIDHALHSYRRSKKLR